MVETQIEIATSDGGMDTFLCHPDGNGPYPAVIFFMDAPGIREELRDMTRRLAASGYFVLLPDLYYRSAGRKSEISTTGIGDWRALMETLTIPMVMNDVRSILAAIGRHEHAASDRIGCVGYCMSGRYALAAASTFPGQVMAAASIYGTKLVTDQPDSPHLTAKQAHGELYVACAESDSYAPLDMVETFREALEADRVNAEVEIYPGTRHGFAFPSRDAYVEAAAERHWERLLSLFQRNLAKSQ